MLKNIKLTSCLILSLVLVFSLMIGGSAVAKDKTTIAVLNKVMTGEPFLVSISEAAEKRGKELGMEVIVQAASSHGRADEQISIMENLISQNVDGILLLPCDSKVIVPAVEKANEAGIPVVTLDTAALGGEIVSHVATDNEKGSYMAGQALIDALNKRGLDKAQVAMIEGEPGQQTAIARKKGFHKRIKEEPNVEIVESLTGHWTTPGAVNVMEDLIQSHPELDGVFAASDMMGVGAAQVLRREGKAEDISLITFDGLPAGLDLVKKDMAYADVAQYPKRMGRIGIDIMYGLIELGFEPNYFSDFIDSGVEVVTKDKVNKFMDKNWPNE